jgi:serine/threonine-protein kinase
VVASDAPTRAHVTVPAPVPVAAAAAATARAVSASAPAPESNGNRSGAIIAIGIALALLVGLIVFLIAGTDFGDEGAATPTKEVPNVVGQTYPQAEAALQGEGFVVKRHDREAPDQAIDLVLGQDPEQGRKVEEGGTIRLEVSSAAIKMPNVVGQNRAQATATLATSNLTGNFVEEDSDQPPGTVLRTDPAANAPVPKLPLGGRPTVTVVVAREPAVPVPDVSSQDPIAAAATLGQAGFTVSNVDTPSDTVPKGQVVGTDPPAGTPLPKGSAVKLLVSSGPALVDVPSTVGQTRAAAEALLHDQLGFGLRISFATAGAAKKGLVVGQNPNGGQAAKGSTIDLVVGL